MVFFSSLSGLVDRWDARSYWGEKIHSVGRLYAELLLLFGVTMLFLLRCYTESSFFASLLFIAVFSVIALRSRYLFSRLKRLLALGFERPTSGWMKRAKWDRIGGKDAKMMSNWSSSNLRTFEKVSLLIFRLISAHIRDKTVKEKL